MCRSERVPNKAHFPVPPRSDAGSCTVSDQRRALAVWVAADEMETSVYLFLAPTPHPVPNTALCGHESLKANSLHSVCDSERVDGQPPPPPNTTQPLSLRGRSLCDPLVELMYILFYLENIK